MLTTILYDGLGNRLFNISKCLKIQEKTNIDIYFSDKYDWSEHWTNKHYETNIFNKLNFEYIHPDTSCRSAQFLNINCLYEKDTIYISDQQNFATNTCKNVYFFDDILNDDCSKFISEKINENIVILSNTYNNNMYISSEKQILLYKKLFINIDLLSKLQNKYNDILKNSLCVQVRRGDFLKVFPEQIYDKSIYYKYIKYISAYKNFDNIIILTNDVEWCKNNLKDPRIRYIDDEPDYNQFYIASLCDGYFLVRSSYSYWFSILNDKNINNIITFDDNIILKW